MSKPPSRLKETLDLLAIHYRSFREIEPYAEKYGHPHPCDTRAWSQIVISALTGIQGVARKKGADLIDGSDVKAANTWGAIDTPRFNGCIKAGTKSATAGNMSSLDGTPLLFFVLWDAEPLTKMERCRVWVVRPKHDKVFRATCARWFQQRMAGEIRSNNFQLHPPRNKNSNIIRNSCGNLEYPLFFTALRKGEKFTVVHHAPDVMESGQCKPAVE